jgi:hypothetical protein
VPKPITTYANTVQVRTTPSELVLDFGMVMEGATNVQPGEPEVRVIMSIAAMRRFGEALINAAQEHEKASQQQPVPAEQKLK